MDKEEFKALLTEVLPDTLTAFGEKLSTEILSQVDRKNSGLAASLNKDVAKAIADLKQAETPSADPEPSPDDKPGRLTTKAVQSELEQLKQQLADEKAAKLQSDRKAALTGAIASKGTLAQGILFDALDRRFGDNLKQDDGQWFVMEGDLVKPLETVVSGFLETDEGKHFLPASGVNGGGSSETVKTPAKVEDMSASDLWSAALSEDV